jgi:hypothetical protein
VGREESPCEGFTCHTHKRSIFPGSVCFFKQEFMRGNEALLLQESGRLQVGGL